MARLSETQLKRLEDTRSRSLELTRQLSDPATFGDARRAAELGREQADVASVVGRFEQYEALVGQIEQAEELLRDGADDDLRVLARDEIAELEPRVDEV